MIKIEDKNGTPAINGITCTFDTVEIRNEIEGIFEVNKEFVLPKKYTFKVMSSKFHGQVSKILHF